jgi:hypothetical protein
MSGRAKWSLRRDKSHVLLAEIEILRTLNQNQLFLNLSNSSRVESGI